MIHEATRYTRYQSSKQLKGDAMEMKSKLYLQNILLINYIMEENLFVNVVSCKARSFTGFFQKIHHGKKDKKRVKPGWTDISGPGPVSFSSRSSLHYIMLTLHNLINLLNVVRTNSFS